MHQNLFSKIVPIVGDEAVLQFVNSLNGNRKHDDEIGKTHGIPRFVMDCVRRVFGKMENKRILVPEETRQLIKDEYTKGTPVKEIARKTGKTVGSIYSVLSIDNVERNRWEGWSKIQVMRLVDMRERKKMTWKEIAQYFGKSQSACHIKYYYVKGNRKK